MGTNYYFIEERDKCSCCGRSDEKETHIGKSSYGWHFILRVYPNHHLNNYADWKTYLTSTCGRIIDEYGQRFQPSELFTIIENRSAEKSSFLASLPNTDGDSEIGLNNLLRMKIDGRFCVGHGEGTYDYAIGDFS